MNYLLCTCVSFMLLPVISPRPAGNGMLTPRATLKINSNLSSNSTAKLNPLAKSEDFIEVSTSGSKLYSGQLGGVSAVISDAVLQMHNDARRSVDPPAANMPGLKWSLELARLAEIWSRRCNLEYGLPLSPDTFNIEGHLLQNVWSGGTDGTIEEAVSSWVGEGLQFSYRTGACYRSNGCRNYLTMISASVRQIGCGLSQCGNGITVVCYYQASSDGSKSRMPYVAGQPCSQCGKEEWCDNELCRPMGRTAETAVASCECDRVDGTYEEDSPSDDNSFISIGSSAVLVRRRRQTYNGTAQDNNCGYLDIPLWIFVGLLVFIVFLGLAIGIIAMVIYICKDTCKTCTCGCRSCRNRGSRSTTNSGCFGHCCRRKNTVRPDCNEQADSSKEQDGTVCDSRGQVDTSDLAGSDAVQTAGGSSDRQDGSDTPDGPTTDTPTTSGIDSCTNTEEVEYREIGVNTEQQPDYVTVDQSTCTDPLATSEASTSTDEVERKDAEAQVKNLNEQDEGNGEEKEENSAPKSSSSSSSLSSSSLSLPSDSEKDINPPSKGGKKPKTLDRMRPTSGVCRVKGCRTCPLHTRDQREVQAEKIQTIKTLIQASRDKNLEPGNYVF